MTRKIKYIVGAIAALALGSTAICGSVVQRGADGYYFGTPETASTKIKIELYFHNNEEEVAKSYQHDTHKKSPFGGDWVMKGYSTWSPDRTKCKVHVIDPRVRYEPEFIGHELMHCAFGAWHEGQPQDRQGK